ncbi:MAG: DUF1018 domain-containing protein [Planctomycetes bacterium]|nr:DUF1018 domain-containing protein [Planctomycetota bacterium]
MLNNQQIKLIQTAIRKAGLRGKGFDGRYRMLLAQYKQSGGSPVTSCKQLNGFQLVDLLAICESYGWQCPGKEPGHFRKKAAAQENTASYGQQEAIRHLAGDLGWNDLQLNGMVKKMTGGKVSAISVLTPGQAYKLIEALKAILSRSTGKQYSSLNEIKDDFRKEPAKDGKEKQSCQVG